MSGRSFTLDAKLDDETALEHDAVAELARDAGEQAVEDQKLTPACEVSPARRRRP
jgi:hypothetical protein